MAVTWQRAILQRHYIAIIAVLLNPSHWQNHAHVCKEQSITDLLHVCSILNGCTEQVMEMYPVIVCAIPQGHHSNSVTVHYSSGHFSFRCPCFCCCLQPLDPIITHQTIAKWCPEGGGAVGVKPHFTNSYENSPPKANLNCALECWIWFILMAKFQHFHRGIPSDPPRLPWAKIKCLCKSQAVNIYFEPNILNQHFITNILWK